MNNLHFDNPKELYFSWLYDKVCDSSVRDKYWTILHILHDKEFYDLVPNDDNRIKDGIKLREDFMNEFNNFPYEQIDGPCSIFEMLIALSMRFEAMMIDHKDSDTIGTWFWEMLTNLGLAKYTNAMCLNSRDDLLIERVLDRFLERTYHRNGEGNIFPLKNAKKNQCKVEIWYQMCAYLLENYYDNTDVL